MRYCTTCHTVTAGEPLFCSQCGGTYDVRLCPRLHPNPRQAQVCAQCGSRDLSQPQPETPLLQRAAWLGAQLWVFLLLLGLSLVVLLAFVHVVLTSARVQSQLLVIVVFLGLLWWSYMQLPSGVRRGIRRKKDGPPGHH